MFLRPPVLRLVAGFVVIQFAANPAWAQKGKNNQERRDNQRVAAAEQDVKHAQEKLRDAERDLDKAQSAKRDSASELKSVTAKLKKTRDQVAAKLEQEFKIDSALADQSAAQQVYDKAKEPILTALKAKPEYQAALKAAEQARTKIKDIKLDLTIAESERKKQLSDASLATLAPNKLEQAAIDADSAAKDAKAKLSAASEKVAALREKIRKVIEADGEIKSAQAAFDKAKATDDKAQDKLAAEQKQLTEAQQKLAREQAQLAQAKLADKKNDGKNNKNKNK